MNKIPFVGHLSILSTKSGNTDIPVAGGHVFGYCLTDADVAALDALKSGDVTTFKRQDGTDGKCQSFGIVSVELEQCDDMDGIPVYRFASKPTRAVDKSAAHFFG